MPTEPQGAGRGNRRRADPDAGGAPGPVAAPGRSAADVEPVMRALTSPVRREILRLIWTQELPAGEIAAAFSVTKPTVSQHLAVLREANLVSVSAVGTSRLYRARREVLLGVRDSLGHPGKWTSADDLPERSLAEARTRPVVLASTTVPCDRDATFHAFTDPGVYSRWMGVPVTIEHGRFACDLEWGTRVRGTYEIVCPPELIVMRWDFEQSNVPLPGAEMTGYLRLRSAGTGTSVEVHQLVDTAEQAEFMEVAWTMVLGRLAAGVVEALDPGVAARARAPRSKRRGHGPPSAPHGGARRR